LSDSSWLHALGVYQITALVTVDNPDEANPSLSVRVEADWGTGSGAGKNLREAVLGAVLAAHSRAVNGRGKAAEKRAAAIKAALRAAGDAVKP
jgi:hypothetical protein